MPTFVITPENLVSRDWFGRPVPRQPGSLILLTQAELLTHGFLYFLPLSAIKTMTIKASIDLFLYIYFLKKKSERA